MPRRLPSPPDAGLVNAVRFGTDTRRFLEGVQARFRDGTAIPLPGRPPLVLLTNPDMVADLLERREDFPRVPAEGAAAMIAERGLVQSEGELWERQRSVMGPAFGSRRVTAYADAAGRRVEDLAAEWAETGGRTLNLHQVMTAVTLRVASEILLGEDVGADRAAQFHEWMAVAGRELEFGLQVALPEWVPTPVSAEFEEAAAGVRALSERLIERRRAALTDGGVASADDGGHRPDAASADLLSLLLRAQQRGDVELSDAQIRDEVATFLIAGHETTALSLTYTLSLLSWHPEARRRVRAEARDVLGDGPPTHDDLADLEYTARVYREALRLYPPAWGVFRQVDGDRRLGEYVLPDGAAVIAPLLSIHRDDRYFEDPEAFDPERWTRRDPDAVDAYMPFSTGPHACVGRGFALSGATLVVARLLLAFDVDVREDALEALRFTPTLRPVDGVRATVRPVE
jgi:cytochrome P450